MKFGKKSLYYVLQLTGWLIYIFLAVFVAILTGEDLTSEDAMELLALLVVGIGTSHFYRYIIIKYKWTSLRLPALIPRALFAAFALAVISQVFFYLAEVFIIHKEQDLTLAGAIQLTINWAILYLIWTLIYFVYNYFENFKQEEIKNLKWEAARKEIELNKLKSQLNPHFIFNSMNTIRALIDEDPKKAKKSITQLSNILRNSLLMGKKKVISFNEEMNIVRDYMEIEKSRFEERLNYTESIAPGSEDYMVPVLMIQTLVENGIKHGIGKLPEGGTIALATTVTFDQILHIKIENPGHYDPNKPSETGFGLVNTRQRLNLLYGQEAELHIYNSDANTVCTEVMLPAG